MLQGKNEMQVGSNGSINKKKKEIKNLPLS